jgi:putative DNA primase/helicase
MSVINEFLESMASCGLPCPDNLVSDGEIHRFNVHGDKPGSINGWYILFEDDGLSAGSYGSWKTGEKFTWCTKEERTLTEDERTKRRERIAKIKRARDAEQKRLQSKAREKAAWIWENSKPVTEHLYLKAKSVKSHGLKQYEGSLVVPVQDPDGGIHSLQFINADGDKNFLSNSAIQSHFFSIDGNGDTLLVCEGYSTGATLHEATGYPVACAMNCGNLKPVCEALQKKSPDKKFIVCADDDHQTDNNPGITKAREAAETVGAVLVVPKFKDQAHRGTDFNDLHQIEGLEAVRQQIEEALSAPVNKEEKISPDIAKNTVKHLASLSPFEYEMQRKSMAGKLGFRLGILDKEFEKLRKANNPEKQRPIVEELEPWPEPVSGAEILGTIHETVIDYVIMPEKSAIAFSLWCILTYCYNSFRILPVMAIVSPEKRCGKTRLLEVLSGLAYRAFPSCNLTPATVYRVIEKYRPCFLVDEADTFLPNNEELRGVLNSGHSVKNAFVTRINPDTMEPEQFSTWGPKAIALIGRLSGTLSTLEDRSICISLKRKLPTEKVERLRLDFDDECLALRQKCKRWATDNMERLKAVNPQLPLINNDRALDNWTPLVAIADLAGGEWPEKARKSMQEIEAGKEDDSARVMLLQDIKEVFDNCGHESLWTENLIESLVAMEDKPWAEWTRGKPLSAASLSKLLKPFEIKSVQLKKDGKNKNGYKLKQFKDAFERYTISSHTSDRSSTSLPSCNHEAFEGNQNSTSNKKVGDEKRSKPLPIDKGREVEFQNGDWG